MQNYYKEMNSPVGRIKLVGSDNGLAAVLWENDKPTRVRVRDYTRNDVHPVLAHAELELMEYFAGARTSFSVKLDSQGTDFQKEVWRALSTIPYGETRSYLDIAAQIGNEKAVRAVGAANGRNPISIIVPCHRVIGSSGTLTGFAGGLEAKACLLGLEGIQLENKKVSRGQLTLEWVKPAKAQKLVGGLERLTASGRPNSVGQ